MISTGFCSWQRLGNRHEHQQESSDAPRRSIRVEELETRLNRNSFDSNQPPSSDSPFQEKRDQKPGGKIGPISLGAIQKIIVRVSSAIEPHKKYLGDAARRAKDNHVDEISLTRKGMLQWLWVMTNARVAFFMIHPKRSKEAFEALIGDWLGILLIDGYGT